MWNPGAYRDTDYGLDDGDRFEPHDDLEDIFQPEAGEEYIQTVLGPIPPDDAGMALVHEYLQWAPRESAGDERLGDPAAALQDLEAFFTASGRTLVSAATADTGRDARVLLTLAQHAPVHIVAATGSFEDGIDPGGLAEAIDRDTRDGLDGTSARPGVIVASLSEKDRWPDLSSTCSRLADAQRAHGLPVALRCATNHEAREALHAGLNLNHLIIALRSGVPSDVARQVVAAGAFLLVTDLEGENGPHDQQAARLIATLVREGFGERILISNGFRRHSLLNGYGGRPGLAFIVEQFAVMLLEEGLEALDVRSILIDNAARALSMQQGNHAASAG